MEVTYCKLGTSQVYVSDSKEEILSGKELYCQILDKFQIKYKVDVKEEETE